MILKSRPHRVPKILASFLFVLLFLLAPKAYGEQGPPNVVLFLVDDLGWMDLGCQGSTFYETPHIDRLAREGMRFTQAYSNCTVCSPSRAALLTGRYPARVGFTGHITPLHRHRFLKHGRIVPPDDYLFLRLQEVTLAEVLKPAGYVSASIGKWHLGAKSYWPPEQGFDLNVASYDQAASYFFPYTDPNKTYDPRILRLKGGKPGEYLTDRLTDEAIRFIKNARGRPFFLYLPHYAVHLPLEAPADLIAKYEQKLKTDHSQFSAVYAAMIDAVDNSLGRVLATVERLGLADNTLVVFTSDNGGTNQATRNDPLRLGKGYLYEGGIRVPLIIKWPGRTKPGSVCDTLVMGADLYPTIADIAGVNAPAGIAIDGRSLVPLIEERDAGEGRDLFWYYPHYLGGRKDPSAAVRSGDFKLIEHYDPLKIELYNLAADIGEKNDLSAKMPEKTAEMKEKLHHWLNTTCKIQHQLNPNYDPVLAAKEQPQ